MVALDGLKSLLPDVTTTDEISDQVGAALCYQYMFVRKTSPWEMASWDQKELMNFSVDADDIDRLYSLDCNEEGDYSEGNYYLVARVRHGDRHIFVELIASCDSTGFECQGGGELYITANPNIFYNVVAQRLSNHEAVLASLVEDGYSIVPQTNAASCPVTSWHNPPRLMLLCHEAVRDNKQRLAHYSDVLPKSLTDSIHEFIQVWEAMEDD